MITNDQIKVKMEEQNDRGYPAFTTNQITDRAIAEDSFLGRKITRAMDLGVTREQALNYYAYGDTHGKPEEEEPKTGFFSGVAEAFKGRSARLGEQFERMGDIGIEDVPRGALDIVGQGFGGLFDIAGEGIMSALRGLSAVTPDVIEDPAIEGLVSTGKAILETDLGQVGVEAFETSMDKWLDFKEDNPSLAFDIESFVNIASVLPAEKLAVLGLKPLAGIAQKGLKGVGEVGGGVARGVGKGVTAPARVAKGAGRFATRQVTGFSDDTIEFIKKHTDFDFKTSPEVLEEGVARRFSSVLDKYQDVESGLLPEYKVFRNDTKNRVIIPATKNPIIKKLGDKGFNVNVDADGLFKVTKTTESTIPLNQGELGKLEELLNLIGDKKAFSNNEFFNVRGELTQLSKFEAGEATKNLRSLAREIRKEWNNTGRPQIKGLEKLDNSFRDLEGIVDEFATGFTIFNKRTGKYELSDSGFRKLKNLLGRGKQRELARMKKFIPDIEDKLKAIRATSDVQVAGNQKVGVYSRSIIGVGGGAAVGGVVGAVLGLMFTSPSVTIPMIRAYAKISGIPSNIVKSIGTKLKLGKKLDTKEARVFGDAVDHYVALERQGRSIGESRLIGLKGGKKGTAGIDFPEDIDPFRSMNTTRNEFGLKDSSERFRGGGKRYQWTDFIEEAKPDGSVSSREITSLAEVNAQKAKWAKKDTTRKFSHVKNSDGTYTIFAEDLLPKVSAPKGAISKELEPLAKEARKFKSAEEFEKANKPIKLKMDNLESTEPLQRFDDFETVSKEPISVWYDVEDHRLLVEDGHNRIFQAKRDGKNTIDAIITPTKKVPDTDGGMAELAFDDFFNQATQ